MCHSKAPSLLAQLKWPTQDFSGVIRAVLIGPALQPAPHCRQKKPGLSPAAINHSREAPVRASPSPTDNTAQPNLTWWKCDFSFPLALKQCRRLREKEGTSKRERKKERQTERQSAIQSHREKEQDKITPNVKSKRSLLVIITVDLWSLLSYITFFSFFENAKLCYLSPRLLYLDKWSFLWLKLSSGGHLQYKTRFLVVT